MPSAAICLSPLAHNLTPLPLLYPHSPDHVVPIKLACTDLNYHVGPQDAIHIMKQVNASFFPGEAVALMGPSGAGKTTLLNILACRAAGKVTGSVTINDTPASPKIFKQIANFVPQDDILIESLTPRQALEYIALLRLSGEVPKEAVKMHLDQVRQSPRAPLRFAVLF